MKQQPLVLSKLLQVPVLNEDMMSFSPSALPHIPKYINHVLINTINKRLQVTLQQYSITFCFHCLKCSIINQILKK